MGYSAVDSFKWDRASEIAGIMCSNVDGCLDAKDVITSLIDGGIGEYFNAQRGTFDNPGLCDQLRDSYLESIDKLRNDLEMTYVCFDTDFPESKKVITPGDAEKLVQVRDQLYTGLSDQDRGNKSLFASWFWNNVVGLRSARAGLSGHQKETDDKIIREISKPARGLAELYLRGKGGVYEAAYNHMVLIAKTSKKLGRSFEALEFMKEYQRMAWDLNMCSSDYHATLYALSEEAGSMARDAELSPDDTKAFVRGTETGIYNCIKEEFGESSVIQLIQAGKSAKGRGRMSTVFVKPRSKSVPVDSKPPEEKDVPAPAEPCGIPPASDKNGLPDQNPEHPLGDLKEEISGCMDSPEQSLDINLSKAVSDYLKGPEGTELLRTAIAGQLGGYIQGELGDVAMHGDVADIIRGEMRKGGSIYNGVRIFGKAMVDNIAKRAGHNTAGDHGHND